MSRLLTSSEATEFKQLLENYTLQESVLKQFLASNFAVIAGPAGAGKDTLRNDLLNRHPNDYLPILSTTTRPMRAGEIEGETYHFRDIAEVKEKLINREYFQAQLVHNQQISCLHFDEIRKLQLGQWGLSILITTTEKQMRLIKPEIKTIFVTAPDLETLTSRLQKGRHLEEAEISRRLLAATKELQDALDQPNYYCLVSDSLENATQPAHEYLQEDVFNTELDSQARHSIKQILATINDTIGT